MNPSTADANVDDPTIRREINFTEKAGFSRYYKVNLMNYRATNPDDLLALSSMEASTLGNVITIAVFAKEAAVVVCAWGVLPKPLRIHADRVCEALRGRRLMCMGTTADGYPRHPLYLPKYTEMVVWK